MSRRRSATAPLALMHTDQWASAATLETTTATQWFMVSIFVCVGPGTCRCRSHRQLKRTLSSRWACRPCAPAQDQAEKWLQNKTLSAVIHPATAPAERLDCHVRSVAALHVRGPMRSRS